MPYPPATLSCPHCRTPLRVRQWPTDVLSFACPDCNGPLELFVQDDEIVVQPASPAQAPATSGTESRESRSRESRIKSLRRRWPAVQARFGRRMSDPLTVTWVAAGVAATALIIAVVRERQDHVPLPPDSVIAASAIDDGSAPLAEPEAEPAENHLALETERPEQPLSIADTEPSPTVPADLSDEPAARPVPVVNHSPVVKRPPVVAQRPAGPVVPNRREEIASRLEQPIVLFEQKTPIAFDVLRIQLEELAGVAIIYEDALEDDPAVRSREISISLRDVTLGTILDDIVRQAGLTYTIESEGIRLLSGSAASISTEPAPSQEF